MAFPTSPTNGQQANINGITYTYSSAATAWTVSTSVSNTFVSINVSDNVNSGNVLATGVISATGNVSGSNLVVTGNIVDTGALTIITGSNGNITLSPNGTGIVTTTGAISTTGNISANNATFTSNQTLSYGTANGVAYLNGSKVLTTGSALVFDGTNLGVGVTPSAQYSGIKSVQVGSTTNLFDTGTGTKLYHNAYTAASGDETYLTTGYAQGYLMPSNGQHIWYIGASGTAGNTFSFTTAMTLGADGNMILGGTSPTTSSGYTSFSINNATNSGYLVLQSNGTNKSDWFVSSGTVATLRGVAVPLSLESTGANHIKFETNSAERMRITSGGDLVVGATSTRGTYKLDIRSDTSIALGSNATYYGTIGYSAGTGYLSLASEAGGGAGIKCLNGTTTLSIIDLNSLYAYVGVNPSNSGTTNARIFNSSAGAGTVTLYIGNQSITTSSDVRLKENIVDTQRNALEILGQLRVVDHTWNDPSDQCENNRNSRGTWMGLIAQEAQPIIPWLVNKPTADVDENGDPQYWHMDYGYSVPLLVKAIQEQQALITQLTARITALEGA